MSFEKWVEDQMVGPVRWSRLAGDGSDRVFWRIAPAGAHGASGPESLVAVDGSGLSAARFAENRAFALIGRHLAGRGQPVPGLVSEAADRGFFLVEDLGDNQFSDCVAKAGRPERAGLYRRAVETLVELQTAGAEGFDPAWCAQTPAYDRAMILTYESGYYLSAFVRGYCEKEAEPPGLNQELGRLAARAASARPRLFLHRDYQSRNLMIKDGRLRVIDFQSGRLGPPGYDLASLLIDPYAGLSGDEQTAAFEHYLDLALARGVVRVKDFREDYPFLALHRNLQILGAFGHLTRVKGKAEFARYIPAALSSLREILNRPDFGDCQALKSLVGRLTQEVETSR